jgi:hypothetical protein
MNAGEKKNKVDKFDVAEKANMVQISLLKIDLMKMVMYFVLQVTNANRQNKCY